MKHNMVKYIDNWLLHRFPLHVLAASGSVSGGPREDFDHEILTYFDRF